MGDAGERKTVFVFLEFLLVNDDLEFVIVGADADIESFATLDGVALTLFLAPFAVGKRVQDDLSFIESDRNVERDIVSTEVGTL